MIACFFCTRECQKLQRAVFFKILHQRNANKESNINYSLGELFCIIKHFLNGDKKRRPDIFIFRISNDAKFYFEKVLDKFDNL